MYFLMHFPQVSLDSGKILCKAFQINQPTRCKKFSSLLLDVYIQLNMFWASSCPSSGATTTAVAASGFTVGAW
jgi:hypothetical protein